MERHSQSNDLPEKACTLYLDDALAQLYVPDFEGVQLPDGTHLPSFRSAIGYVLRLKNGNCNGNLAVLEQLGGQLQPLVRCRVSTSLGNEKVWRGAYAGNAISQS